MTLQSITKGDNKPKPQSPDPVEIEEVLEQSAPRISSGTTKVLWLAAASMLVFFLPLYLFSTFVSEDAKGLSADLGFIRTSLTNVPTPAPAIQKLLTPLAKAQGQLNQINSVYPTLAAPRSDWPSVMTAIGNYDPNQITLASITRTVNSLMITGRANNDNDVTAYVHSLEQSGVFSRVVLQSVHAVFITPTATLTRTTTPIATYAPVQPTALPTKTPTPFPISSPTPVPTSQPSATPTATPDLRDPFEPDDSQPQPIALGQLQTHNFFPVGDTDSVSFLAKAGHYYRVYTTDLAPGVDTYLSVRVGGIVLDNDDARTGSLSSEVVIQNTGPDTTGIATIANRGIYGADKTYKIVVEEATATPTPTPTNTSSPTPTVTPTSTPTATPNLSDSYEPDDNNPRTIYVGETQSHNFYPNGDIDKVSFVAKNGRYYRVLTSNLALGVDTVVTVTLGGSQWTNDDYAPGTGNAASVVCFAATQDGTATATIANSNSTLQYGPDKTYKVGVIELQSLTTSPCVPITPIPVSASLQTKKVPGYAAPIRSGIRLFGTTSSQSVNSPTLEFVINAELKVTAP